MKLTVSEPKEVEVTTLLASMGVRYWEDAEVSGQTDSDGTLIPHRKGDNWVLKIDLATGIIADWPDGVSADVHYKVCDAGVYALLAPDGTTVIEKDGYVPRMLSPEDNGYGDYVILKIDGNGQIRGWKADLSYFTCDDN